MTVLKQLKKANAQRCPYFGHTLEEWALPQWGNAVAGETGELCNVIKKIDRGDVTDKRDGIDLREKLGEEVADVVIYLDLLCQRAGVNLEVAIVNKFNKINDELLEKGVINSDVHRKLSIYYY
jgi:NTP pyrophosphatase (non-canonical NTP hydrolase)